MPVSILVVEDNSALNMSLVSLLQREGFVTSGCLCVADARHRFAEMKPDIVLLDILLPDGYGYDLIQWFRAANNARILMLTALDDAESKRICYQNGADDYIRKPFDLDELLLKLHALEKRILKDSDEIMIGDLLFRPRERTLTCGKRQVFLQPSQAELLRLLYEQYLDGAILGKEQMFFTQDSGVDESSRLQTLVARLRKSLASAGSQAVGIETYYNKGYALTVAASESPDR